jgi:ribose transport system ATP-binding protein
MQRSDAIREPTVPRGPPSQAGDLLSVSKITKRFPGVLALDGVDYGVRRGEVHALCGENGAGKSTLVKIMAGQYAADEGTIVYKGLERRFSSAIEAQNAGIAIIHQELNLVPQLSVAENIFLAREPTRGPLIDRAKLRADAQLYLDELNLDVDPSALVKSLSVAKQQMVEIAKALSLHAEVLIMDEPTSSLTDVEIDKLFEIIRSMKAQGVSVVYISHRLDELKQIVDRVTVLRDGRHVCTEEFGRLSIDEIVAKMVGRKLEEKFPERTSKGTEERILEVQDLGRSGVFEGVSFDLRRGEILGFAGLIGAGRTEVARAIFGADPKSSGTVVLNGRPIEIRSPIDAVDHGIAYLSEDRKGEGLALGMSLAANVTMANIGAVCGKLGFLDFAKEERAAESAVAALEIKTPSIRQVAKNLSGGNQQKVVIGKWLFRSSKVLLFDEPTRGIDVGAKFAIYKLFDKLAAEGIGVILITSDLPEILGMTDRVAVFHEGHMTGLLETRATSQEEIMQYASGRKRMDSAIPGRR